MDETVWLDGIRIRIDKCELYHASGLELPEDYLPQKLKKLTVKSLDEAYIMGVPIGTDAWVLKLLEEKMQKREALIENIKCVEPITALGLLRKCLANCKVNYWLRTVPPDQMKPIADRFDAATAAVFAFAFNTARILSCCACVK